jgi:hypothetical protein
MATLIVGTLVSIGDDSLVDRIIVKNGRTTLLGVVLHCRRSHNRLGPHERGRGHGLFRGYSGLPDRWDRTVILAPRDPTSLAAYAFPLLFRSGNLYLRAPQARVERLLTSRLRATAGIVAPVGGDLTGDAYLFVPPALGGERSRRPGLQARLAYTTGEASAPRLLDIGLSGHTGWERRGTDLVKSWATAVDFAARRDVIGVAGELFVADNADRPLLGQRLDRRIFRETRQSVLR